MVQVNEDLRFKNESGDDEDIMEETHRGSRIRELNAQGAKQREIYDDTSGEW